MAPSRSAEDLGPSPQTCCATCGTIFEVAPELLVSSDTRVRCGECFAIFDARANLLPGGERSGNADSRSEAGSADRFGADEAADDERDVRQGGHTGDQSGGQSGDQSGDQSGGGTRADAGAVAEAVGAGSATVLSGGRAASAYRDAATGESSELDVTYSDFDLFSEDADLPDVAYFDQTRDTPDFDFDSVALEQDETFSDTLFVNDATIDAGVLPVTVRTPGLPTELRGKLEEVGPSGPREPLAFKYRDPVPAESPSGPAPAHGAVPAATAASHAAPARVDVGAFDAATRRGASEAAHMAPAPGAAEAVGAPGESGDVLVELGAAPIDLELDAAPARRRRWPVVLMVLTLGVLLAGLHGYRVREAPGRDPFVRPVWVAWCRITGCEVPALAAIERLRMVRREMFSHPSIDDALVIDVAFRNEAPFEQPYPVLVVQLSDPSGRLVARRAFRPEEYLSRVPNDDRPEGAPAGGSAPAAATLAAGALLDISLEVTDPGEDASSFTVEFRES